MARRLASDFLPDDDVDRWFLYRKDFPKGLDDMSGNEKYVLAHGDIYHLIGELYEGFKEMRFYRNRPFHPNASMWYDFEAHPYALMVWGRLMNNLDQYRLFYIVTMNLETHVVIIYSCWPTGKDNEYKIYRWRGELQFKCRNGQLQGQLRRYQPNEKNLIKTMVIKPCWPTWKNIKSVKRPQGGVVYDRSTD
jgi:hypothetical protein